MTRKRVAGAVREEEEEETRPRRKAAMEGQAEGAEPTLRAFANRAREEGELKRRDEAAADGVLPLSTEHSAVGRVLKEKMILPAVKTRERNQENYRLSRNDVETEVHGRRPGDREHRGPPSAHFSLSQRDEGAHLLCVETLHGTRRHPLVVVVTGHLPIKILMQEKEGGLTNCCELRRRDSRRETSAS